MRRLPLTALLGVLSVLSLTFTGYGIVEEAGPRLHAADPGAYGEAAVLGPQEGFEAPSSADLASLAPATGLRFGIDASSIEAFRSRTGAAPDYATIWVGKWNLDHGWRGTDQGLAAIHGEGVTPLVQFYYWGDDISKDCLDYGCDGKDTGGWQRLAEELVYHLQSDIGGGPVVVVLESEFNKHGVHEDQRLDQLLADKATYIRQGYPSAQIVLGLGNWYPEAWTTWDQAAAACDYVGLQALGGTTQDSSDRVLDLYNNTLRGVERLRLLFGKPVFVQDVAVSSYPEPDNLPLQEKSLSQFAQGMPGLQAAGVEAVVYRSFVDVPDMALSNHYAEAERHWGLAWADTGQLKPGGEAWVAAVQKAHEAPVTPEAQVASDG